MKPGKRRCRAAHQVIVSPARLLSNTERRIFTLQVAFRNGRAQISIHLMRSVVRLEGMIASGIEFTRREIGFRAKIDNETRGPRST